MAIHRRKDNGEGRTTNAAGKVVSSGAAASRSYADDTAGALSLGRPADDPYAGTGPVVTRSYTQYGTFYVDTEPFEIEQNGRRYLVEQITGPTNQYGHQYSAVAAELDEDGQPSPLLRYLPDAAIPENVTDAVTRLFPDAPPLPPQEIPEPAIQGASIEDGRIVVPVEPFEAFDGHRKVTVTKFVGGVGANGHVMRAVCNGSLLGEEYLKSERTPAAVIQAARELFRDDERDAEPTTVQPRNRRRDIEDERRRRDAERESRYRDEQGSRDSVGIEIDRDSETAKRQRRYNSPSQMTRDIEARIDDMEISGADPQWISHLREENEREDATRREQIAKADARQSIDATIGLNPGAFPTMTRAEPDIDLNW